MKYLKRYEEIISVHDKSLVEFIKIDKWDFEFDPKEIEPVFRRFIKDNFDSIIDLAEQDFSVYITVQEMQKFYSDEVGELLKILIHNLIFYSEKVVRVDIDILGRIISFNPINSSVLKSFLSGYHFGLFGLSFKQWIDWYEKEYPERIESDKFNF